MSRISAVAGRWLAAGALITLCASAAAQTYPSKPIRFISPFAPGGTTTILARLVGERLTKSWGQQVLVDNRPGGNTLIGTEALFRMPADGYSILLVTTSHLTYPMLTPAPYDAVKDFAPIATLSKSDYMLTLHPSVPSNSLQEFIAYAKARPGQLNFSSPGSGGMGHLAGELFNIQAGVQLQHIAYKGGAPATADLVGGQVQLAFVVPLNVISHIRAGKLKAIAVSSKTRMEALPQMPTFIEAGLPSYDVNVWFGVLAKAGTPADIISRMSTEITNMLNTPETRQLLASQGMDPLVMTPEQFGALMRADNAKYAEVIKTARIKIE
jgi:tripartite-type tricarboxylate transporter receptor subunit TctC